jgi:hypothetical protein
MKILVGSRPWYLQLYTKSFLNLAIQSIATEPNFGVNSEEFNIWDYWIFGPHPSSSILKNTAFRKLNLFQSSG